MGPAHPIEISLSRIAHDLRGPLMPLRTAAWLLREDEDASARIHELADIVDRQSVRLSRMMDELSDWGRTTGDRIPLSRVPVDVGLAMDMAIGSLPGCHVEPVIPEDAASFPLHADPHRLGQVLRTLIEHATHRDTGGQPEVALAVVAGRLQVRVRDHGDPLDPGARDALLAQPQASPFDDGLGLRLLLARRIAEAHGGSLEIDDTMQDGLALICSLPPGT
ncbi:MAG TPA: ATP-binding protein [Thermomonas sp.]|nr:ATP-binding protein [Thermomonas sp.]